MSTISPNNTSICANCGKGGEDGSDDIQLKSCAACKMVKYCSRECQIAHRPQHKKECRKRVAELHDEMLFKQPPHEEDCPLCFIRLPSSISGKRYMTCCGKVICSGCIHAVENTRNTKVPLCAFCRTPAPVTTEEADKMTKERIEANDPIAICDFGCDYFGGNNVERWHRAGELGNAIAYLNIGNEYYRGKGLQRDTKKAQHYWELAAMSGDAGARYNLGALEYNTGNFDKAVKHYMIAAGGGCADSLKNIKQMFMEEHATKDDYATALKACQAYLNEIRSDQRDKAAAANDRFKYY